MLLRRKEFKQVAFIIILGIISILSVACINNSGASVGDPDEEKKGTEVIDESGEDVQLTKEDKDLLDQDGIYKGVTIDGIDVSSLTREEAISHLKDLKNDIINKSMNLVYNDKTFTISLKDIDFDYYYEGPVEKAYAIGRKGTIENRLLTIKDTQLNGKDIALTSDFSRDKIREKISEIAGQIDIAPVDANFSFSNGRVSATDSRNGLKVDSGKLEQLIVDNIFASNTINIPVVDVSPTKSKAQLGRINGVIGEFSTSFAGGTQARATNIRLSTQALNGILLMPGESLSFNGIVGNTTEAKGYKNAPVIVNGELVDGIGGGICQTSTTLYNAAVRANLSIVARRHHSLPISYVPLGHDAAVSYGGLDLRIRNDYDFPIFINSRVSGSKVYFSIYGDTSSQPYSIRLESTVTDKIEMEEEIIEDSTMKPGAREIVQKGRTGYKVETYKVLSRNGKVVSRTLINKDYYRERKQIVKVGPSTAKPEPTPEPPEADPIITITYPEGYNPSNNWQGPLTVTAKVDKGSFKNNISSYTFEANGSFEFIVEYKGKEYKKTVTITNIVIDDGNGEGEVTP